MADTSKIPFVLVPFADNDQQKVANINFLRSGVTAAMSIPTTNGGMKFTREMLNGIGYFATLGGYLDRIGYPYGKDRDRGTDFKGYPKGAILISEDNDYVREYVSQIDNNTMPLPQEAADGTYEGNEYWKPTLPPVVDFFPDLTTYVHKGSSGSVTGTGTFRYVADEDGWYELEMNFTGYRWPTEAKYSNPLYEALCSVTTGNGFELCRLDGRFSVLDKRDADSRQYPRTCTTIPLKKGVGINFKYRLTDEEGYYAHIGINRWGISSL